MNGILTWLARIMLGSGASTYDLAVGDTGKCKPSVYGMSKHSIPVDAEWQPVEFIQNPHGRSVSSIRFQMGGILARRIYQTNPRVLAAIAANDFLSMFGEPYKATRHLHS